MPADLNKAHLTINRSDAHEAGIPRQLLALQQRRLHIDRIALDDGVDGGGEVEAANVKGSLVGVQLSAP